MRRPVRCPCLLAEETRCCTYVAESASWKKALVLRGQPPTERRPPPRPGYLLRRSTWRDHQQQRQTRVTQTEIPATGAPLKLVTETGASFFLLDVERISCREWRNDHITRFDKFQCSQDASGPKPTLSSEKNPCTFLVWAALATCNS